jgi:signal transduction histidine kinase
MGRSEAGPEVGGNALASSRSLNNRRSATAGLGLLALGAVALAMPALLSSATVNAPSLSAALEMTLTLFALGAAWLLRSQFVSSRRLRDLQLVAATLTLGLITFAVAAVPAALDLSGEGFFAGAQLWGTVFVGAMFAASALMPAEWLVVRRRQMLATTVGLSLAGLLVAGLGGLTADGGAASIAVKSGPPLLVVAVVGATALLAYAALGFVLRAGADVDGVAALMAIAMTLLAGATFSRLLAHSLPLGRIGVADGLRAAAFGLILTTAVVRERRAHVRISKATALAERRRVARDLHDGIAQDLAFIAAHGPRFVEELGDDHPVVVAARRALAISRSTISELSDPNCATAHESLQAIAQELGDRFSVSVAVNAQLDRELTPHEREHVTRIAREAIANAARHGGASNVIVSLRHDDAGIALRVVDDGCGIWGADLVPAPEGFGLTSMRERAAALGGELNVRRPRLGGTELEVVLP